MIKDWFKKKNEITFYCSQQDRAIYDVLKPGYAANFMPDWYKNLPTTYKRKNEFNLEFESPTVRSCHGIKETIRNGFIFPMWCDFIIEIDPDRSYRYQFSDAEKGLMEHNRVQYHGLFEDSIIIKFKNPWIAKTSRPASFYATQPLYHIGSIPEFFISPGFISFNERITNSLSVFIIFPVKPHTQRIMIPVGFPLMQLISTENCFWHIKTECISQDVHDSYAQLNRLSFLKVHDKLNSLRKTNE